MLTAFAHAIDLHNLTMTFKDALAGMADPWVIVVVLVLTTFLLEDVAIAAGVALAVQGTISWSLSLAAVAGGIAAGDVGLYALGVAATRIPWLRQRYVGEKADWGRAQLQRRLSSAILLARVIPGLRLVTYTVAGFVRVPFVLFCGWVLVAVALWTGSLYVFSVAIGHALALALGIPLVLAAALPILLLALAIPAWRTLQKFGKRRLKPTAKPPSAAAAFASTSASTPASTSAPTSAPTATTLTTALTHSPVPSPNASAHRRI